MRAIHLLPILVLALACVRPAAAQHTVRGTVTDSVAGRPLPDATVQLVAPGVPARAAATDSLGRFAFTGVPEGRYALGFLHPALDSLGLEPVVRAVTVAAGEVRADLAIPAPARLRDAFCGAQGGGAIMGFVRLARDGAPVQGASVVGEWLELSIGAGAVGQRAARREATTNDGGGYLLCDVPAPGSVRLAVARGADATDRVEADVPEPGFVRRDLYLGESRAAPAPADSLAPAAPRTGPGRLSGVVLASEGGQPLAGATVGVVGGNRVRAGERGEWTLSGAPSGTRILEVRAPGYYPVLRAVDIAEGAAPVRVTLSRLAVVLETLRVNALARPRVARSGFEERRTTLGGRYLTSDEIARRRPLETSDLLRSIPGLFMERGPDGQDVFSMRSAFGAPGFAGATGNRCVPAVIFDGMAMRDLGPADVDALVRPDRLAAIEVYQESQVPPQFQVGLSGCGSIVLWTR